MTLPGMPAAVGDPGVFICGPDDIAPHERRLRAVPQPARVKAAPAAVWLVQLLCPHCNERTHRYCTEHDIRNWWLTHWGGR